MITLVQARNYRNLRDVRVPLREFQLLVGKNASGKSTLMDVIAFMSDFVSVGLEKTVETRSPDPGALVYGHCGDGFELAVEAIVPSTVNERADGLDTIRYQIAVQVGNRASECRVRTESLVLTTSTGYPPQQRNAAGTTEGNAGGVALVAERPCNVQPVAEVASEGVASFTPESVVGSTGAAGVAELEPGASALAALPADGEQFPAATWFKQYLLGEIHRIAFDDRVLARPNPPSAAKGFVPDGSNVAHIVGRFRKHSPDRFRDWVHQLGLDARDLVDISVEVRPEDGHSYLVFEHQGGVKVPAWLVSSGLLHLAAYTLPTYLAYPSGTYLYERPERGVYAGTMQLIHDALLSLWDSQALVATQSTSLMAFYKPKDLLCFARDDDGEVDIVWGPDHRYLKNWSGRVDVGSIVASGILG